MLIAVVAVLFHTLLVGWIRNSTKILFPDVKTIHWRRMCGGYTQLDNTTTVPWMLVLSRCAPECVWYSTSVALPLRWSRDIDIQCQIKTMNMTRTNNSTFLITVVLTTLSRWPRNLRYFMFHPTGRHFQCIVADAWILQVIHASMDEI